MELKYENQLRDVFSNGSIKDFFRLPFEYKYISIEIYRSWHTTYFEVQPDEDNPKNRNYTSMSISRDRVFNVDSGNANYSLVYRDLVVKSLEICLDDNDCKFIDIQMKCKNIHGENVNIGICIDLMADDSVRLGA